MDLKGDEDAGRPDEPPRSPTRSPRPRSVPAGRKQANEGDDEVPLRTNACKRARQSDPDAAEEEEGKRRRTPTTTTTTTTHSEFAFVGGSCSSSAPPDLTAGWRSVEDLLGVPVNVVLRQASNECASGLSRNGERTEASVLAVASPPTESTTTGGGTVVARSFTPRHSLPASAPSQSQAPGSGRPRQPCSVSPLLLSRSEAQCFFRVRLLAQELDGLVHESSLALERRWECRVWRNLLLGSEGTAVPPWLRPLVSILHTLGEDGPAQTLIRLEPHLNRVTQELRREAECLRQFSEQNWAVAESCFGGVHDNDPRSVDKRRLSDLQDECCHRIEVLLRQQQQQQRIGHTGDDDAGETECLPTTSLDEFCRTLWEVDCASTSTLIEDGVDSAHPGAALLLVDNPATEVNRPPSSRLLPPQSPPTAHCFVYPEDATTTAATSSTATPPPRGSSPTTTAPSQTPKHSQSVVVLPSEEKENSQQQLLLQELMDAELSPAAAPLRALSSVPSSVPSSPACRWSTGRGGSSSGVESLPTLSKVATATAFQPTAPGRGNASGWSQGGIGVGPASSEGSASLLDATSQQQSAAAAQVLASLLSGAGHHTNGGDGAGVGS